MPIVKQTQNITDPDAIKRVNAYDYELVGPMHAEELNA